MKVSKAVGNYNEVCYSKPQDMHMIKICINAINCENPPDYETFALGTQNINKQFCVKRCASSYFIPWEQTIEKLGYLTATTMYLCHHYVGCKAK
jgi:hypothetical protein